MNPLLLLQIAVFSMLAQPTKLQLIEEALDRVLLTHSVNYEKGNKLDGKLADVTITYTGNTVIDVKQDSIYYYVYGSYTFAKYTYVNAPNPVTGGNVNKSYNTGGSRSYVSRVKSVLDDFRVQDIIVVNDPENFVFQDASYDALKQESDWIYPTAVYQSNNKSDNKKKDE